MKDTIAAIASGMTASGIGIIRISGPEAFAVLERIFQPRKKGDRIADWAANTIHYGYTVDEGKVLDECLVMAMRAPHSYTTEDTIEINCHGGTFVMRRILELVLQNGARLAEPGEFTKRAFLGGRIDLTKAEAVMDIISSTNDDALRSSVQQLSGSIHSKITSLRERIMNELAYIEAALDDPEHYDLQGYPMELMEKVNVISDEIQRLLRSYQEGRIIREGITTVILGKPNAGKSSLLNALSGADRAIVTDIEGTTRDVLEESVTVGGVTLRLLDTAGIRSTEDQIEQIGVERAKQYADDADLILTVIDSSRPLDQNDIEILHLIQNKKALILLNKTDLSPVIEEDDLRAYSDAKMIPVSAKIGDGMEELGNTIRNLFLGENIKFNEEIMITNIRHKASLESSLHSLALVKESILSDMPEDFFSVDLMDAYGSLGEIIGEEIDDDLADTIFSKFCMGK